MNETETTTTPTTPTTTPLTTNYTLLCDGWRLTADPMQWTLEQRRGTNHWKSKEKARKAQEAGEEVAETWGVWGYYPTLGRALHAWLQARVREGVGEDGLGLEESVKRAAEEMARLVEMLREATTVKLRLMPGEEEIEL